MEIEENSAVVDTSAQANESTEVEQTEKSVESDHLSPEVVKNVEKFGDMSDSERTLYLEKLQKGGRKEAVQAIQDVYNVKIEQKSKYTDEQLAEMESVYKKNKRVETVKNWVKTTGSKIDPEKVLMSKDFLAIYHSDELKSLPTEARTELALSRTVKNKPDLAKRENSSTFTGKVNAQNSDSSEDKDSFIALCARTR